MSLSIFRIHICDGSPRGKRISYHCIIFSLWKGKKSQKPHQKVARLKALGQGGGEVNPVGTH